MEYEYKKKSSLKDWSKYIAKGEMTDQLSGLLHGKNLRGGIRNPPKKQELLLQEVSSYQLELCPLTTPKGQPHSYIHLIL